VTLLLRQIGPGETRVSIRTAPPVDATRIAAEFGGGGHARRAGCTVHGNLDAAIVGVVSACRSTATASGEA
jgi:bifunctional oligoribonuclease and PAP phosphatase NrnA